MDVIHDLLRIKRIREESRDAERRHARQQFELAAEALRKAKEAQAERDRERAEREQALYRDVCTRVVLLRDLDDLKLEVDVMKEAAKNDAQAVADAQTQRQRRRDAFDEAQVAWRVAAQAKERFEDLAEEVREAHARHLEWLAELELEEFPGRSPLARALEEDTEEA